jgi:hypothetical protein
MYMIQGDMDGLKRVEQLDGVVFGRAGLPLAPLPSCIVDSEWYNVTEDDGRGGADWEYHPTTNPGDCNIFDANCDHCYGRFGGDGNRWWEGEGGEMVIKREERAKGWRIPRHANIELKLTQPLAPDYLPAPSFTTPRMLPLTKK